VHSYFYGNFAGWDALCARLGRAAVFISSRRNIGYWRKPWNRIFDRFRNAFTDLVIANSNAAKEAAILQEGLSADKLVTIYNGVDIKKIDLYRLSEAEIAEQKEDLGFAVQAPLVGTIANIKQVKGHIYLIEAANEVVKEVPEAKFIVIGGEDDPYFADQLRKRVQELGIAQNVLFMGLIEDPYKMLSIFDVFVLPSLSESCPNVILEAMAMAKPVVATDVGGNSELVIEGQTGFLVCPKDASAMAKNILRLLKDKKLSWDLAMRARGRIEGEFNLDSSAGKMKRIYEALLEKKLANINN
jgi:glycosyltransferase involved in cell wall biosynthesis